MLRYLKHALALLLLLSTTAFAPLVYLIATMPIADADNAAPADVALIFGALVRNGKISPLQEERLKAGQRLLDNGTVPKLVLSNSARAAGIMADYLAGQGVPREKIEIDGQAPQTPDTCTNALAAGYGDSVILVSQRFHLPRISLQCRAIGITGQYVAANGARGPNTPQASLWTKLKVRGYRHTREAILTWVHLLGLYR